MHLFILYCSFDVPKKFDFATAIDCDSEYLGLSSKSGERLRRVDYRTRPILPHSLARPNFFSCDDLRTRHVELTLDSVLWPCTWYQLPAGMGTRRKTSRPRRDRDHNPGYRILVA